MSDTWENDGPVRPAPQGAMANAVPAPAAWTPLVEVDHRAAQPLLDILEDAGVAAYAEPQAQSTPVDRIHVDATRRDVAEAVVAAELPGLLAELGPGEVDLDPFDAIVAAWDAVPESRTWPEAEDVRPARKPEVLEPDLSEVRRHDPAEDHYVPPPAPPVKYPSQPATRFAIVGIVLGLVALVVLPVLGHVPSQGVQVLGAISILAGLGTLIYRMRDRPSVDDGPDDGAVL
jgi:hypothetical protein